MKRNLTTKPSEHTEKREKKKERGEKLKDGERGEEGVRGVKQSCDYYPNKTDVIRDSEEIAQLRQCCKTRQLVMGNQKQLLGSTFPTVDGNHGFRSAISFMAGSGSGLASLMSALLSCTQALTKQPKSLQIATESIIDQSNQINAEEDGW